MFSHAGALNWNFKEIEKSIFLDDFSTIFLWSVGGGVIFLDHPVGSNVCDSDFSEAPFGTSTDGPDQRA